RADEAYALLSSAEPYLGIVLEYPRADDLPDISARTVALTGGAARSSGSPVIGVVGAGNYGSQVLVPAFRRSGARLKTIVTAGGVKGVHVGDRNGFEFAATEWGALLN